jgi:hypothetical protein
MGTEHRDRGIGGFGGVGAVRQGRDGAYEQCESENSPHHVFSEGIRVTFVGPPQTKLAINAGGCNHTARGSAKELPPARHWRTRTSGKMSFFDDMSSFVKENTPDMPDIKIPDIEIPDVEMPDMPKMPKMPGGQKVPQP